MFEFFQQLTLETRHIFTDAAPYVIFGFLAAVLLLFLIIRATWQARISAACCGEGE